MTALAQMANPTSREGATLLVAFLFSGLGLLMFLCVLMNDLPSLSAEVGAEGVPNLSAELFATPGGADGWDPGAPGM
jgi:hypothetical protein